MGSSARKWLSLQRFDKFVRERGRVKAALEDDKGYRDWYIGKYGKKQYDKVRKK